MVRRLLVISDTLDGGLGVIARQHVEWFADRGWSTALTGPPDGPAPDAASNARWHPIPTPGTIRDPIASGRAARALSRVIKAERPQIVHIHGLRSTAIAAVAGVRRPFVTLHGVGPVPSDPALHHRLRRLGLSAVPRLAREASTVGVDFGPPWRVICFASPRLTQFSTLPFPAEGGTPTFAWVGLLDERKQPEIFVRALAELHANGRAVRGLMAGTGPRASEIADLVRSTGSPVELLGHVDPIPVLAESWAATLFSRTEGIPLAVEEAMWAGRAVVASALPGIEYLMGATGRVIRDGAEAATALAELCDHATAREAGRRAGERIREVLLPDSPWSEFEAAYLAN
jgi:glycosyltransferase involved in cell wall biosynthesis